jgi:hypothetical protein
VTAWYAGQEGTQQITPLKHFVNNSPASDLLELKEQHELIFWAHPFNNSQSIQMPYFFCSIFGVYFILICLCAKPVILQYFPHQIPPPQHRAYG